MIDNQLLPILVCPLDHTALGPANGDTMARLNRAIAAGRVKNRAGRPVEQAVVEGLIRADQTLIYPVCDGIPLLVPDEAISLSEL
jgi:uncharacterized protein YbaR (Trm112 family)